MYDIFKDLTPDETEILRNRLSQLGISDNEINSINLPYTIIESISDDELLRQVNMRKNLSVNEAEYEDAQEELEDSTNALKAAAQRFTNNPTIEEPSYSMEEAIEPVEEELTVDQEPEKPAPVAPKRKPKARLESGTTRKRKAVEKPVEELKEVDDDDDEDEDLYDVPIVNVSSMHAHDNYKKHISMNVSTYEVVLPQSGYAAKMRGLTADEIDVLRNSINMSYQSSREDLTKIVFNCIRSTGLKRFNIKDFEDSTSLLDFNILLFGILHQTYGALNSFDFTCPHCSSAFKRDIVTNSLIQVKSQEASDAVIDIKNSRDREETFKNSLLRTYRKRMRIPETDIIIEIGLANIVKDKTIGSYFSRLTDKEKNTRKFFLTSIITKLLLPQYDINGGVAGYVEVTSPSEIYEYLDDVKSKSYNKIIPKINKLLEKYTISFKIPNVICPSCRKDIEGSNIDMADYFLLEVIRDGFVEPAQEN